MQIKISVIVPLYNDEKYFKDCFDSIVNQTIGFKNTNAKNSTELYSS